MTKAMTSADPCPRCLHCDGPHEIENCPAVIAALGPDAAPRRDESNPAKYRGQPLTRRKPHSGGRNGGRKPSGGRKPRNDAKPCAKCGGGPRVPQMPYCRPCRQAVVRASYDRRRPVLAEIETVTR